MSATTKTKEYLFSNYGHLIQAEDPVYDENRHIHVSKLISNYPIMIRDDKGNKRFIRRIKVPYLGEIILDERLHLVQKESTDYSEVNKLLQKYIDIWTEKTEQLVAKTTADLIVKLPEVQTTFNPLRIIINRLWEKEIIREVDIKHYQNKMKIKRTSKYLELLEGIDMVQRDNGNWIPGPDFLKVQSKMGSLSDARSKILSIVLQKRYPALRQVFDIGNFERVMKIENVVYLPETEENRQIFRDEKTIQRDLHWYYRGKVNPMDVHSILTNLQEVGAIAKEDNFYAGQEDIRFNIIKERALQPSLESTWIAAMT